MKKLTAKEKRYDAWILNPDNHLLNKKPICPKKEWEAEKQIDREWALEKKG